MKSFTSFLMDKSIDCNLSVQLGGTKTGIMKLDFKCAMKSSESWARNMSKIKTDF